jgi:hypothetical protein
MGSILLMMLCSSGVTSNGSNPNNWDPNYTSKSSGQRDRRYGFERDDFETFDRADSSTGNFYYVTITDYIRFSSS